MPDFRRSMVPQGFEDPDFEEGLSDRLIDTVVACGDEKTLSGRLEAHHLAGATRACVHPLLHPEGKSEPAWPTIEALTPARA